MKREIYNGVIFYINKFISDLMQKSRKPQPHILHCQTRNCTLPKITYRKQVIKHYR